jgi:HEAT repeat protein
VRASAAWALGMLRDEQAVDPLTRALKDRDASVRVAAAEALATLLGTGRAGADHVMRVPRVRISPRLRPNPNPHPNPNPNPNPRPRPEFTWVAGGWW